jgi:hypothetical protein
MRKCFAAQSGAVPQGEHEHGAVGADGIEHERHGVRQDGGGQSGTAAEGQERVANTAKVPLNEVAAGVPLVGNGEFVKQDCKILNMIGGNDRRASPEQNQNLPKMENPREPRPQYALPLVGKWRIINQHFKILKPIGGRSPSEPEAKPNLPKMENPKAAAAMGLPLVGNKNIIRSQKGTPPHRLPFCPIS